MISVGSGEDVVQRPKEVLIFHCEELTQMLDLLADGGQFDLLHG